MGKITKSLILKLLIIYLAGMALLMFVTLFVQSNVLNKQLLIFQQSKIEKLGDTIAAASSDPMSNFNFSLLDEFASQILKDPDITDVVFKDADGKRLNSNIKTNNKNNSVLGKSYMFPILSDGSKIGSLEIRAINKTIKALSSNLQFQIGAVFASGFVIFIFLLWFTSNKLIISPLNLLLSSMQSFKNSKKEVVVEIKSNDEIGRLSESFNSLTKSLIQNMNEINFETEAAEKAAEEANKMKKNLDTEYKYLERSTNVIIEAMNKFGKGDLSISIKAERDTGEIYNLFESFNRTVTKMKQTILQVADAVDATSSASTQISSSAEEMTAGAQEQSAQTSEIATAMEEMSSTIVETNQNTALAAEAAKDSGVLAEEGGRAVEDSVAGMEKISQVVHSAAGTVKVLGEQSEKIGKIVDVINDIADQTNLLALNAAIEAARAGEQGRGFAVVADEVRKLAERTTTATKEIADMIKQLQTGTAETVSSIEQGVEEANKGKVLVAKAGELINEIVKSSSKVMDVVTQVATASEEQSATAEEISKNIESINMVAQESANGVGQIAKAAEDLNRLTEDLQQLVNRFKV